MECGRPPPRQARPGWGGGDAGPLGVVSLLWMGLRGDEHLLRQVFRSHPPGGRVGPGGGARHGAGHVLCARGHVQAAPLGLQDRRGPRPVVADHQRHPPMVPPVGDLGQCAHHDLEMGGGLPKPAGVRADSRPPPLSGRGRGRGPGAGGPTPPQGCRPRLRSARSSGYADDTGAVALGAATLQGTFPATEEWLQVTGQDLRVDKSCSSVHGEQGTPAVLLRGVPISMAATFRQLGVDVTIGGSRVTGPVLSRCAWKRGGAPYAAPPTSPSMTARSGLSARWSPRWRSMGWLSC